MEYKLRLHEEEVVIDTRHFNDYEMVWDFLRLSPEQREDANKIIFRYNEKDSSALQDFCRRLNIPKAHRTTGQRCAADHYMTLSEINSIPTKSSGLVKLLIDDTVTREDNILVVHNSFLQDRFHPQAVYKINPRALLRIQDEIEYTKSRR